MTYIRAALAALALMWSSGAALAGTIITPVTTTYSAGSPFTVQWTGIGAPGAPVSIQLTGQKMPAGNMLTIPLEVSAPNTGTFTVPAATMRSVVCSTMIKVDFFGGWTYPAPSNVPVSQLKFNLKVVSSAPGGGSASSPVFYFKCPKIPGGSATLGTALHAQALKGSLTIVKRVINESSITPPPTDFFVSVSCRPGGSKVVKLSNSNGWRETLTDISPDSACTIEERPPVVPPKLAEDGCRWETRYPDGQQAEVKLGETVTLHVENHWICK